MTEREPSDWQEPHSPTIPVEVVTHYNAQGRQVREAGKMRKTDARLWALLDREQIEAVERIVKAAEIISGAMHRFSPVWSRERIKAAGTVDARVDLQKAYLEWQRACPGEGIHAAVTLAIWRDGMGIEAAASTLGIGRIKAKAHMLAGLDLYCFLTGIKRRPKTQA